MTVSDFVSAYTVRNGINPKVLQAGIIPDKFFVREGNIVPGATIPGTTTTPSHTLYEYGEPKRSNIAELVSSL